jgi:hypothetical protein
MSEKTLTGPGVWYLELTFRLLDGVNREAVLLNTAQRLTAEAERRAVIHHPQAWADCKAYQGAGWLSLTASVRPAGWDQVTDLIRDLMYITDTARYPLFRVGARQWEAGWDDDDDD